MRSKEMGSLSLQDSEPKRVESNGSRLALVFLFGLVTQACAAADSRNRVVEPGSEQSIEIPSDEAAYRQQFIKRLVELEKQGFVIDFQGISWKMNTNGTGTSEESDDLDPYVTSFNDSLLTFYDPLKLLELKIQDWEAKKGQQSNSNYSKEMGVYAYQFVVSVINSGNIKIELKNVLTGAVLAEIATESAESPLYDESRHKEKLNVLLQVVEKDRQNLVKIYSEVLRSHGVIEREMDIIKFLPGEGLRQIQELGDKDLNGPVIFSADHPSRYREEGVEGKWEVDPHEIKVGEGTPEMAGNLTSVSLDRYRYIEKDGEEQPPDWWKGSSENRVYIDKYRNLIHVTTDRGETEDGGSAYTQDIYIAVSEQLLPPDSDENMPTSWSVDLTVVGLPEMKNLVFHHPESSVKIIKTILDNEYVFYFYGDDSTVEEVDEAHYKAIVAGIEQVEAAFGDLTPSQLIKKIRVLRSDSKNAYFFPRRPDTVGFTDDHLRKGVNTNQVISTARHEAGHGVFKYLNLHDNQKWNSLFQELKVTNLVFQFVSMQRSFGVIPEEKWQNGGFGGHPQDNSDEFFTSFINTLLVEDLEGAMRKNLRRSAALEYAKIAQTLQEILSSEQSTKRDSANVPILEKLALAEKIAKEIAEGK